MGDTRKIKYYKPRIPRKEKSKGKKILIICLSVLGVILLLVAAFFAWLTITEYNPADHEDVAVVKGEEPVALTNQVSVLTWNIGYSGLGKYEDFVMDGGKTDGSPDTEETFKYYLEGIIRTLRENESDIYIMQEVDSNSKRSYHYDEASSLAVALSAASKAFAINYKCNFVPFPWPPIGQVEGGLLTLSKASVIGDTAERIALSNNFTWPMRIGYLKRCLLVTRYAVPDSDKELVVINFHLEAYDDGSGSSEQMQELWKVMKEEYDKGNYVIAGGDCNQAFPGTLEKFPILSEKYWKPGVFDSSVFDEGWRLAFDDAVPTCRSLDRPYDVNDTTSQHYVIDGFILSPNIELVSINNIDTAFEYADHNPVRLQVNLK